MRRRSRCQMRMTSCSTRNRVSLAKSLNSSTDNTNFTSLEVGHVDTDSVLKRWRLFNSSSSCGAGIGPPKRRDIITTYVARRTFAAHALIAS